MSLRPLLSKELRLTRRNLFLLGFLLVALPAFFVGSTVVFQETVPRDVPVAVVAGDETISGDELAVVGSGLALFTEPTIVESRELALERLERERVYAIVEVPGGLFDPERAATVSLTVDGSIVPFLDPSEVITDIAGSRLSGTPVIEGEVTTERVVRGDEKTLPEYLFPVFYSCSRWYLPSHSCPQTCPGRQLRSTGSGLRQASGSFSEPSCSTTPDCWSFPSWCSNSGRSGLGTTSDR